MYSINYSKIIYYLRDMHDKDLKVSVEGSKKSAYRKTCKHLT